MDVENKRMDTKWGESGVGWGRMNWEIGTDIYIYTNMYKT